MSGWVQLDRFLATDPGDVGCEQAMQMLHVYVDLVVTGTDAEGRHPGIASHLRACGPCSEDFDGLLAAVTGEGSRSGEQVTDFAGEELNSPGESGKNPPASGTNGFDGTEPPTNPSGDPMPTVSPDNNPSARSHRRSHLLRNGSLTILAAAATLVAVPVAASAGPTAPVTAVAGHHTPSYQVFSRSFVENPAAHTVTLPLYSATSGGSPVYFVITDASTKAAARLLGVNWAPRLANARHTAAVQKAGFGPAGLVIPASVDYSPVRVVVPGPTGFPPVKAIPGAVGEPGYSPLIELPDGTVLDAPQVANRTGHADKLVSADPIRHRAVYRETDGFYDGKAVHYASFDASIPLTAALENATFATALNAAPADDPRSVTEPVPAPAREEIGIVTNGQLGAANPQRQGLSSALLDGLDPLNILGEVPENDPASHYSPLWDANLATWTPAAIAAGKNRRVTTFDDLLTLADRGLITAPDGTPFARSNFLINCPAISIAR